MVTISRLAKPALAVLIPFATKQVRESELNTRRIRKTSICSEFTAALSKIRSLQNWVDPSRHKL